MANQPISDSPAQLPATDTAPVASDGSRRNSSGWARGAPRANLPVPVRAARRLLVTAFTSTATRRLYPVRLSFPAFRAYAVAAQRANTFQWRENRRFYEELLRYTPLAGSEADVARRAVAEFFHVSELFWRPWLMGQGQIEGLEHYESARSQGRGVVAPFPHFGNPYIQFPVMRRFGIDAWVIASPHHYMELGDGYDGRFARQGRKYVDLLGEGRAIVRLSPEVPTQEGAFDASLRQLRDSATVSVAFDSVGTLPTPFMGRLLHLASGPAKLAWVSDAMVAPFVSRIHRYRPLLKFAPPLDPRDFDGPEALQAALAAIMEAWAFERPHSVWPLESQPGGPPLIKGPPLNGSAAD